MIVCVAVIVFALIAFAVIELSGVFDPAGEDTFSEWVFDLPLGWVLTIAGLSVVVGVVVVWSGGHYLEGWARRRKLER